LRDRVLSALAAAPSERRWEADRCCAFEAARSWPVSTGTLLSTSAPKLSFACDWSGRAGLCGAAP